jgi:hypothetical protein
MCGERKSNRVIHFRDFEPITRVCAIPTFSALAEHLRDSELLSLDQLAAGLPYVTARCVARRELDDFRCDSQPVRLSFDRFV